MGEIIQLGRHRLLQGDSAEREDVEKLMRGDLADMVLTDPPYGMRKKIKNDNRGIEWYQRWAPFSFDFLKPYGNWMCFGNTHSVFYFYYETLRDKILSGEISLRCLLKWDKGFGPGTLSPANNCFAELGELLMYCVNGRVRKDGRYAKYFNPENEKTLSDLKYLIEKAGGIRRVVAELKTTTATHWRQRSEFAVPNARQLRALCELASEPYEKYANMKRAGSTKTQLWYFDNTAAKLNDTLRYRTAVHNTRERTECGGHPTVKPVKMLEDLIKMTTPPGGIVLDLFGGSGSTLIACENTGRICYMMEIDPKYIDVICKRYELRAAENSLFA